MVGQLLLEGTDAELYAWIETKMCSHDPEVALRILEGALDHDLETAFAGSEVPIRGILGELTPLNLEGNRALHPDFDAVVIEGCGHYPQLENPDEFNRHLLAYVDEIMAG
jgi:pimeloyl-ACP methyl ester carboxylesterase